MPDNWFQGHLFPIAEDTEVRICRDQDRSDEDLISEDLTSWL